MVPESVIDTTVDLFNDAESELDAALERLQEQQPIITAYLMSEEFEAFTEAERDYLLFLALVVWHSAEAHLGTRPVVTEEALNEAEEKNWESIKEIHEPRFRERVSHFFLHYPEEDLLAFVEDALVDDEDSIVTKEGREALFITLKSIIDVLTAA